MTIIAEFTVPSQEFALAATLAAAPEMIVDVERVVAHADERIMPFFWIREGDYDAFEAAVEDDPSVEGVTLLDEFEEAILYRAEWTQNIESLVYAYLDVGATILEATGRGEEWELQMRFTDASGLSDFQDFCAENDITYVLDRLYQPSEPRAGGHLELSPKQRDALTKALEEGYFDVPRSVTMEELADGLGISQQSLSKRLRRAHRNLVTSTLTVSHPEDENSSE